ncbi:MAG TPA: penicillin-binding protein 2 [Dongiaceae bacterium]|jgi:penicillin-binding protein 2|nr:penicillin-binding protein 2 [Dongiaceae bacterium]
MKQPQQLQKTFTRRAVLLGGGQALLFSVLVGRMYYLQVVQTDRFRLLAEENRVNLHLLPPLRGKIVDRFGTPLAINDPNYRVVIVPEQTANMRDTLQTLARILPLSNEEIDRLVRDRAHQRAFLPMTVKANLDWDMVSRVEVNLPDLPGASIEVDQSRSYPFGGTTSHVLGYVGTPAENEVGDDPLLQLPGFRIGKSGLEKVYDVKLRGTAGTSEVEVNALGRVIRELDRHEGKPGAELVSTLDIGLQQYVQQRLSAQPSASAVVLDIMTGDVLAMGSTPSFDPAVFNRGLSPADWQELSTDPGHPLINKAMAGQYPPGSTFKTMTAMAALEAGVDPSYSVFCPGFFNLGNLSFHCWWKGGHGTLDMLGGIKHSCDVYFYDLARKVGIDTLAGMARRFGFGQPTGIDLPGEKAGLIPDTAWKKATLKDSWHPGETVIAGIGQGFIQATPLQLAVMVARLANGGFALKPRLVRPAKLTDETGPDPTAVQFAPMGVNLNHIKLVWEGMRRVVNDPDGTAYNARISQPGMEMAGKTGSAQVRRITMAERLMGVRKNEDLPWAMRDHALFIAFAPVQQPRYACSVVVEHGSAGARYAGPIAHDILLECQLRDPARPPQGRRLASAG